jgi:hypothetical protein
VQDAIQRSNTKIRSWKMSYDSKEIDQRWKTLQTISGDLLHQLGPQFTSTKTGHIVTDISAAGSLAGLMILQEVVVNLPETIATVKPGNVLLAEVYEGQNDIFRFLTGMFLGNRVVPKLKFDNKVIEINKPMFECEEMTKRLSAPFYESCEKERIEHKYYKFAAALTGFKLVMAGISMKILESGIGQDVLRYYVVAGSKTIPYREALWKQNQPQ